MTAEIVSDVRGDQIGTRRKDCNHHLALLVRACDGGIWDHVLLQRPEARSQPKPGTGVGSYTCASDAFSGIRDRRILCRQEQ